MYPSVTDGTAKDCFSRRLRQAREAVTPTLSQERLGELVNVARGMIVNYEGGRKTPDPERAVRLAEALKEDPVEFLLLSQAQRSAESGRPDPSLLRTVNVLLEKHRSMGTSQRVGKGLASHVSLMDFRELRPMTIIVGDKREEEPRNAGDLFVFSASTVDDRWILNLGLPPGTEKLSDKILMTASQEWLQETLGRKHILCIGSPASNLFTREYNDHFLFRFAISQEARKKWVEKRDQLKELRTPAALLGFREQSRPDLKQMMRLFKQPGFVDFHYRNLKLGIDPAENRDFAVVSLGRNPFVTKPDAPFFAILAAGVHHPGTAHAVKWLSDPEQFRDHPFGGILEVQVPADDCPREQVMWHNKIEKSKAEWHRVGQSSLEYSPEKLRDALEQLIRRFDTDGLITDVDISRGECERHIRLIDVLAQARASESGPRTGTPANQSTA